MTKKDYIRFANVLAEKKDLFGIPNETVDMPSQMFHELVSDIADIFEDDNKRFDRDEFFKAIYR